MSMFETKQEYDTKLTQLENEIDKFRLKISEKISELNLLNEKLVDLQNEKLLLQSNLNTQVDSNEKLSTELNEKTNYWKKEKIKLDQIITKSKNLISNVLPVNEFKEYSVNVYNKEFLNAEAHKLAEQVKFFQGLLNSGIQLLIPLDIILNSYIERFNFIYSNIEIKTEHKGFLFSCDRLRTHLYTLQQVVRSMSLFSKVLSKHLHNSVFNTYQIIFNANILITLLNHSAIYFDLLYKYFRIFLQEERKISNFDNDCDFITNKIKINKDLRDTFQGFVLRFKLFVKKVNKIFNFDLEYHLKMITVFAYNTNNIVLKVNESYFKDFPFSRHILTNDFTNFVNKFMTTDFVDLQASYSEFAKLLEFKLEVEFKMFELIKEENKSKYNYPNINLISFRTNTESIKKIFKEISADFFSNLTFSKIEELFLSTNWELANKALTSFLEIHNKNTRERGFNKTVSDSYSHFEKGVPYEEAINNRRILREMMEKENSFFRDRESYLNKITEYEDDIRRLEMKLNEEKNNNDMLIMANSENEKKLKLLDKYSSHIDLIKGDDNNNNVQGVAIDSNTGDPLQQDNQFAEYLNNSINLTSIKDEILSDDVQSGKQRSAFKLTSVDNKGIPLTKFTAQVESNSDVTVLYHQKILEKFQHYSSKVRNIDIKVLAQSNREDIKNEYEFKMLEIEKKLKEELKEKEQVITGLQDNKKGFDEAITYLTEQIEQLNLNFSRLQESVKDCQRCKQFVN
jgi:hypothetical protein